MSNRVRVEGGWCTNKSCASCWMDEKPKVAAFDPAVETGPLPVFKVQEDGTVKQNVNFEYADGSKAIGVDPFDVTVYEVFKEAEELLLRKHQDYGPLNISRSPGGALNGLRVRMWDKIARLNNLVDKDVDPQNESLRDTLIDIANYALIGVIVLDDNWPKE